MRRSSFDSSKTRLDVRRSVGEMMGEVSIIVGRLPGSERTLPCECARALPWLLRLRRSAMV